MTEKLKHNKDCQCISCKVARDKASPSLLRLQYEVEKYVVDVVDVEFDGKLWFVNALYSPKSSSDEEYVNRMTADLWNHLVRRNQAGSDE